ncbi:MAG: nucleotidyltransferase domain-containing protein [Deltaproteobacteria bacterium]|nr:nucleotidyltransferase domain-containing protein [Deltaproteobacteria bacterium]
MQEFGLSEKNILLIKDTFKKYPQIEEAVIFGSRAMGNYKKGSDIDMALKGENINFNITAKINYKLNEEFPLPYMFDIVNYNNIDNENLKRHIDNEGKIFYNKTV